MLAAKMIQQTSTVLGLPELLVGISELQARRLVCEAVTRGLTLIIHARTLNLDVLADTRHHQDTVIAMIIGSQTLIAHGDVNALSHLNLSFLKGLR